MTALTSVVEESIDHVLSLVENDEPVWQSNSGTGPHESVASQEHVATVVSLVKSAEGSAGLLHKFTKPTGMERRSTDLEERRRGHQSVGPL